MNVYYCNITIKKRTLLIINQIEKNKETATNFVYSYKTYFTERKE